MVLLIGNYPADQQQSMQRFAMMMLEGLRSSGVAAELVQPAPFFGRFRVTGEFVAKWLGYIDKFLLFPARLRRKLAGPVQIVHICDHSYAMYAAKMRTKPVVVTCHDLLAVRGSLGEVPDAPASFTGKFLQRWIISGLRRANAVVCVSPATLHDAERLVQQRESRPQLFLNRLGLNYPYHKQSDEIARAHLAQISDLDQGRPFLLHVGSNLRMKNREGILRIFALTKNDWPGQLVFAGQKLTPELRLLGERLGILDRVVEVENPPNDLLEALYSTAFALLYPSRFEGFGWPIIEAQACGCPVICSAHEPMSEVAGEGGITCRVDDEPAFAEAIIRLTSTSLRAELSEKAFHNAERFRREEMIRRYIEIYRGLGAAA